MHDTIVQGLSTLLGALIGALFTMQVFRGGKYSDVAREQLNTVYARAFDLVEPVLYKNLCRAQCDSIVAELEDLSRSGGILSSPELKSAISAYNNSPDGDLADYEPYKYSLVDTKRCYLTNWYLICSHIDRYYDTLCKRSFLPLRSINYRLERSQYINGFVWAINFLRFDWANILFFLILIAVMLYSMLT